ncbi:MAG: FHA domain-containing protein [Planctomycetota bacterium]
MTEFVLEVLDGEMRGRVISLGSERLTLGRRPNNDVVLKDEKASGNHAEVVREGDAFVLRDLESRNGTFLDGRKVSEVSLSPGDVFKIGLTGLCFRRASEASAVADTEGAGDLSVHRIDQARLQGVKRGGGMLGMVAALVLLLGAAGWVWFRYGGDRAAGQPRGQAARVVIPGNLLAAEAAAVDDEAAWDTGAGGVGFGVGGPGHRGGTALVASRDAAGASFAVARLREPVRVLGDDRLTLSAQARCDGGASVALRLVFGSSRGDDPLAFAASTSMQSPEGWQQVAATLVVPTGLDRARVEVVALLPSESASVAVDEIGLVREGEHGGEALSARNGVRMLLSGASAAVVLGQDVLLQGLRPLPVAGSPLAALAATAGASLAEAGGTVEGAVDGDRFTLKVAGVEGVAFEFAGPEGFLVRAGGDAPFTPAAPDFAGDVQEFLIGGGTTRLLWSAASPVRVQARSVAAGFQVQVPAPGDFTLQVGFEDERREARERVRVARVEAQAGRYASALPQLQEVASRYPHDDAVLGEAQQLRAEITAELSGKLDKLAQDLDTAKFFSARSGLVRVLADLDGLVRDYGEGNLGRPELVQRVRTEAGAMIADLDRQQMEQRAAGLQRLADAMQQTGNGELATVIENYLRDQKGK